MPSNKRLENVYIAILTPVVIGALGWAVYNFPTDRLEWRLAGLSIITVFFSSFLRIQLPRTKIHVTTSDAAIILVFLWYGGEILKVTLPLCMTINTPFPVSVSLALTRKSPLTQ
jgi:hypothetical protein